MSLSWFSFFRTSKPDQPVEMANMSKHEYKKLANTHIAITSLDNSSSTLLLNSGLDGEYTLPSAQINGQVSYLQDLEDLPQGRHLGLFSTIVLFVLRILGSGIFSLASGIYEDCGRSIFLFFLAWVIAAVLALSLIHI